MPHFEKPCSVAMNQFLIKVNNRSGINAYIYYFLNSSRDQSQIQDRLHGATTKTITKDAARSIMIPLPPLDIQEQIVTQIQEEQKLVDANKRLIEIFEQKIKDKIVDVWGVEHPAETTEIRIREGESEIKEETADAPKEEIKQGVLFSS